MFTRTFISHVDADGQMGKPFVLPQKSPSFYDSCYSVYTMPELIAGPVSVGGKSLVRAIEETAPMQVNSVTGATSKASRTETYKTGQSSVQ